MDTMNRVEDYLGEAATAAWAEGRWRGKVFVGNLMIFLKSLDHKATVEEIDAFVEKGGRTRVEDYLDEETGLTAWKEGKWRGKVTIDVLLRFLMAFSRDNGAKASAADVDSYLERRVNRKEEIKALRDLRPDPDCGPLQCGNPRHNAVTRQIGETKPTQPMVVNVIGKDDDGNLVRKTHHGGGDAILEGQFLVRVPTKNEPDVELEIRYYCYLCKCEANERREAEKKERLRWYSYAGAKRVTNAVEGQMGAKEFEDGAKARSFMGYEAGRKVYGNPNRPQSAPPAMSDLPVKMDRHRNRRDRRDRRDDRVV